MDFAEELVGAGGQGRYVVGDLRGGHDLTLELDGTRRVLDGDVVGCGFLVVEGDLERLVRGRRDRCRRELEVLGDHDDRIARRGGGGRCGRSRAGGRATGSAGTSGGDDCEGHEAQAQDEALHRIGTPCRSRGLVARPGSLPAAPWRQAPAPSARRPVTRPAKVASSLLTTAMGLPSIRAKSTATRTISATSMALAM